jgi:hypothetical protein|tara:strand:+ start:7322 stop:7651 length:330 start_codon:yes stop_codon:yes gene_type:complete
MIEILNNNIELDVSFKIIFLISLFCLGLRSITDDDKIGYPLRKLAKKLPKNLGKPILLCCTCMSSVWGTIIYWYFFGNSIPEWILVTISASFLNSILWELNTLIIKKIK